MFLAPGVGRGVHPRHDAIPPIEYDVHPPSSGPHRPQWGKWGEYEFCPPQRWLYNLEHGGMAFLHHPCADPALIDELRSYVEAWPDDDGGAFRWTAADPGCIRGHCGAH